MMSEEAAQSAANQRVVVALRDVTNYYVLQPSTSPHPAKRNPHVAQAQNAPGHANIAQLPADIVIGLIKRIGAIGQWRVRAVCKTLRALVLKLDPMELLQEHIPSLLIARKAHQLIWFVTSMLIF